jgi:hypothetical protein
VRCRYCGDVLRGLLPIDHAPDGAMLLHHLSWLHRAEVRPLLERMRTEDIGTVAMEAFERVHVAMNGGISKPGASSWGIS